MDLDSRAECTQLHESAKQVPEEWRTAAGSRFALLMVSFTDKIRAIKWIREVTGDGLGEAKAASDNLPHALFTSVPFETVHGVYKRATNEHGRYFKLQLSPGPPAFPFDDSRWELVVCARMYNAALPTAVTEVRAALAALLVVALGISADDAERRAQLGTEIVLATNLTVQEARNRRLQFDDIIPQYDGARGWYIWVSRRAVPTPQ